MTIPQPNLYTKNFKDISDEMLTSIPKYTNKWTNHNPSDPGITILEMLAWIGDTTLYRIDRMPDEAYISFLRLVAGAAGLEDVESLLRKQETDRSHQKILNLLREIEKGNKISAEEIKASALTFLGSRFRAVTEEDFSKLAIEATDLEGFSPKVKRAIIFAKETKVEIIIVPDEWVECEKSFEGGKEDKYEKLIAQVVDYLNPRRLIGTIIEVKKPVFAQLSIDIEIISNPRIKYENVEKNVKTRIENYLDPFIGGSMGKGWHYGRALTGYKIAQVVEKTEGVEKIASLSFDGNRDDLRKDTEGFIVPKVSVSRRLT